MNQRRILVFSIAAAILCNAGLSEGADVTTLAKDIIAAKNREGDSYQRYIRDACLISNRALDEQKWDPKLALTLKMQGFKVDGSWSSQYSIYLPDADYISPGGTRFQFEVRFEIVPVVTRTTPTWMKSRVHFSHFSLENTPFSELTSQSRFPVESVLDLVIKRPLLNKAVEKYPTVDRFWIGYRRQYGNRFAQQEEWLESGFDVMVHLSRVEPYKSWSMIFNYFAQSGLDPLVSSFDQRKSKPVNFVPADTIEEPIYEDAPEEPAMFSTFGAGFQQVIYRLPEKEWPQPPAVTKAYSVADLRAIPANIKALELDSYSWQPGDLKLLAKFTRLEKMDMSQLRPDPNKPFAPEELLIVSALPRLRSIDLPEYGSDDRLVAAISKLKNLEEVGLRSSGATDSGIAKLASLSKLKKLDLRWCKRLTDRSLSIVAKMSHLRELDIAYSSSFSDAGVSLIKKLSKLESLSLGDLSKVTPKGLKAIGELKQLQSLSLGYFVVDPSLLKSISKLPRLASLDLQRVKGLNDREIIVLSNLKAIRWLSFIQCEGVTVSGAEALRARLPGKFAMNK